VFGCTGERDKEKRPLMGEIAARLADVVIVTSDDTRGESQDEIAAQIMSGIHKSQITNHKIFVENDRRKAIEMAVEMAKPGDVVLLAGKGHEKTILHGTTECPWSDVEEAKRAIKYLTPNPSP
jgi:UDP-N-acetylmuramoyl-L-alanyl-D-glutamate--2,6-diaminopimelate ligase